MCMLKKEVQYAGSYPLVPYLLSQNYLKYAVNKLCDYTGIALLGIFQRRRNGISGIKMKIIAVMSAYRILVFHSTVFHYTVGSV